MSYQDLSGEEILDGVMIHRIPCKGSKKHMSDPWEHLSYIIAGRRFLKKLLVQQSFDVCHTHFILPTGILAKWMKKRYNIPYIITSHGNDVPEFNSDRFKILHHFTPPIIRSALRYSASVVSPFQYLSFLISKAAGVFGMKIHYIQLASAQTNLFWARKNGLYFL